MEIISGLVELIYLGYLKKIEITIADGSISGNGPVNRWSSSLEDNKTTVIAATRMAGPADLMSAESRFFRALEGSSLELNSVGNLVFIKEGAVVLEFTPLPSL